MIAHKRHLLVPAVHVDSITILVTTKFLFLLLNFCALLTPTPSSLGSADCRSNDVIFNNVHRALKDLFSTARRASTKRGEFVRRFRSHLNSLERTEEKSVCGFLILFSQAHRKSRVRALETRSVHGNESAHCFYLFVFLFGSNVRSM